MSGQAPKLDRQLPPSLVPYDKYPTKGRDIFIAAGNDGQFRKLAQMLGRPELADDPRFQTNNDRETHRLELRLSCAILAERSRRRGARRSS